MRIALRDLGFEIEHLCDCSGARLTEEGTNLKLENRTSAHLVRIQGTQDPVEVIQNIELIAVIANQQAADAMRKAAEELAGGGDPEAVLAHLTNAKFVLNSCAAPELTSEAAALLDEHERKIRSREIDSRGRKNLRYEARYYGRTSSSRLYTGSGKKPGFSKKPTVDEQLNEKPMITQEPPKPDPNTYWVVPGKILAGEYPGARDPEEARRRVRRFLEIGVRHFIDLTEAGEPLEPYDGLLTEEADSAISYQRIPIRDESVPEEPKTMAEIIAAIDRGMAGTGITYVHCWGGVGRTGLVVACWLQQRGQTPDEALTNLARNGARGQNRFGSCTHLKPPSK